MVSQNVVGEGEDEKKRKKKPKEEKRSESETESVNLSKLYRQRHRRPGTADDAILFPVGKNAFLK